MNCYKNTFQNTLFPDDPKYFKEEIISKVFTIPQQKPDIERILDILVFPEIENVKLVETPNAISNEGNFLSGSKLVVEVNLKTKVTYVACEPTQSVHSAHFETLKSIFVILPKEVDGEDVCNLLRADRITATPYIEDTCFRMLSCREIHHCSLLFLDVTIC